MATKTIGQLTQATTINNADEFAIEQSGVTKRVAASVVRGDIVNANIKSDAAIAGSKLADDSITNAKIKSDAAIAYSKLAALNSAQILVGNGSNVPTAVSVTGDVTISNAGVTAIAAGAVVTADVADAAITPAKLSQPYTLATAQASTSGTSIDFTGIPSWARRVTLMFSEVSTNGSNDVLVQLGDAGGFENTGYVSTSNTYSNANATAGVSRTDGFAVYYTSSAHLLTGHMMLTKIDGNSWVSSHAGKLTTVSVVGGAGSKTLSDTLTQVRITTVNGTNTFDAGSINIAYEG